MMPTDLPILAPTSGLPWRTLRRSARSNEYIAGLYRVHDDDDDHA
jgi:hypothetical protein